MTKEETLAKFHTKTIHEIDYNAFDNVIKSVYGQEFCFVADRECGNDSTHSLGTFKKQDLEDYAQREIAKFVETGDSYWLSGTLAQDLVNKGYFPEGEIIVDVCW